MNLITRTEAKATLERLLLDYPDKRGITSPANTVSDRCIQSDMVDLIDSIYNSIKDNVDCELVKFTMD